MAELATAALISGLALTAAGTITSVKAAHDQADAQKDEIAAQQKAEATREQGQKLDAMRKQREMVRQGILARSQALTQGSNQGAGAGSGIAGAMAGVTEQTGYNVLGVGEASQLGSDIFSANREAFGAKSRQADAGALGAVGGGLSTLGGAALRNIGNIDRLGGAFSGYMNSYTGNRGGTGGNLGGIY